jgi:hypothetical protein
VTSTIGFPPLDFSLVGLAKPPGRKWVHFFEGERKDGIAQPAWSVSLAHSVEETGLIVVKTAPRDRWDRDMGGEVGGTEGRQGISEYAFGLLLWLTDSGRPAPEGNASLKEEERASYNQGLVTFSEDHGAEWETWETARWTIGEQNLDARIFRFAHGWVGFTIDDPDRYIGVISYNVSDIAVHLDEVDGSSYNFDFTQPFDIEDLQDQVGSRPNVESIIRAPKRYPDHQVVMATPSRVISSTGPRPSPRQ